MCLIYYSDKQPVFVESRNAFEASLTTSVDTSGEQSDLGYTLFASFGNKQTFCRRFKG